MLTADKVLDAVKKLTSQLDRCLVIYREFNREKETDKLTVLYPKLTRERILKEVDKRRESYYKQIYKFYRLIKEIQNDYEKVYPELREEFAKIKTTFWELNNYNLLD